MNEAGKPHPIVWFLPDEPMPETERAAIEEALEAGVTAAAEWLASFKGGDEQWHAWGHREMGIATEAADAAVATYRKIKEGADADTTSGSPP